MALSVLASLAARHPSSGISLIGVLLSSRSPSTVSGFVSFGIVDPVNAVALRGALPHVCEEREEIKPAIANLDSLGAIARVGRISWVTASTLHGRPCGVRDGLREPVLIGAGFLADIFGKSSLGFFGVRPTESGRSTGTELSGVSRVMLRARAAIGAPEGLPPRISHLFARERGTDSRASLRSERPVLVARTIGVALRPELSVPSACAPGFTFRHASSIDHPPSLSLERVA
jgi:hypothetical protein